MKNEESKRKKWLRKANPQPMKAKKENKENENYVDLDEIKDWIQINTDKMVRTK